MGMTTQNFGNQNNSSSAIATQDAAALIDGLAEAPVVIQAKGDPVIAALKPGDAGWDHCNVLNDYK
jgi:hypothetical protein